MSDSPFPALQPIGERTLKNTTAHTRAEVIGRLKWLAEKMDSAFQIPGTSRTIGYDSLIGLIPGFGDAITGLISVEFVRQAYRLGARKRTIFKMVWNVLLDLLLGSIPLLGDIFDFAFKANSKNVKLLEDEFLPVVESTERSIEAAT